MDEQLKGMLAVLVNTSIAFTHHKATVEELEEQKREIQALLATEYDRGKVDGAWVARDIAALYLDEAEGWDDFTDMFDDRLAKLKSKGESK